MSAPVMCTTCAYQWSDMEEYSPCEHCREYDYENEIYSEFRNYIPAVNADLLKNIPNMIPKEIAEVMIKICRETRRDWNIQRWEEWLEKRL